MLISYFSCFLLTFFVFCWHLTFGYTPVMLNLFFLFLILWIYYMAAPVVPLSHTFSILLAVWLVCIYAVDGNTWAQVIALYPTLVECITCSSPEVSSALKEALGPFKDFMQPPVAKVQNGESWSVTSHELFIQPEPWMWHSTHTRTRFCPMNILSAVSMETKCHCFQLLLIVVQITL